MSIRDQIIQLVRGKDLAQAEAAEAMEEIMTGAATPAQIAAFLTALHIKGETEAEIAGMAQVMRDKAMPAISASLSPLRCSAVRKAAICAGVAAPVMISSIASAASACARSLPRASRMI